MYSLEIYKQDKLAIDAAREDLSALVLGEKIGRTAIYQGEYARIAGYFSYKNPASGLICNGSDVRRVARMFVAISTSDRISGFDCNVYNALLTEVDKKLKSMRVFKRRAKIKCFAPRDHRQPCFCARLEVVQASALIANAPVPNDLKEELQAKVSGALVLEAQFEHE